MTDEVRRLTGVLLSAIGVLLVAAVVLALSDGGGNLREVAAGFTVIAAVVAAIALCLIGREVARTRSD